MFKRDTIAILNKRTLLEAGENPALCRNGNEILSKSDTANVTISRAGSDGLFETRDTCRNSEQGIMGEVRALRGEVQAEVYRPDLYGAHLFASGEHDAPMLRDYVRDQEMTHIAEGIELRQLSIRYLRCAEGGRVLGFGDQDIEEMAVDGHKEAVTRLMRGEEDVEPLVRRRLHDISIAQKVKRMAAEGEDGDAFFVVTPYGEEMDDGQLENNPVERVLGHWRNFRRSFIWMYRKMGDQIECTDITVDQSHLGTYRALLAEFGIDLPPGTQTHDVPGYTVDLPNIADDEMRLACAKALRSEYARLQAGQVEVETDTHDEAVEALEFIKVHAYHHLSLLVDVHEAIGKSLETGVLQPLVLASAEVALQKLECLSARERSQLNHLVSGYVSETGKLDALATVIRAQRYGIWSVIAQVLRGEAPLEMGVSVDASGYAGVSTKQLAMINFLYANTNRAAAKQEVMPGCAGATSFVGQNAEDAKDSIFGEGGEESFTIPDKIRCIKCNQYSSKEEVVKKESWCCPKCKYEIDICTGATLHESVKSAETGKRKGLVALAVGSLLSRQAA